MPRGKVGRDTDDDEYDYLDTYYDDDDSEEEDYVPPKKASAAQKPAGRSQALRAGAQKGAPAANKAAAERAAASLPGRLPVAGGSSGFRFDTPSPCDVILAAQQKGRRFETLKIADKPAPASSSVRDAAARGPGAEARKAERGTVPPRTAHEAQGQRLLWTEGGTAMSPDRTLRGRARERSGEEGERQREGCWGGRCWAGHNGGAGGGKPKLHMVVVGHVDAGKSTLMGRLLYELGVVSQKEVHKQEREAGQAGKASFSWAWLLDERPQERSRGITVDLAHARFETPARRIALLDAPGHRDFVPNMIAGAAQADCAVLVVDGSVGGFEAGFRAASSVPGGQTREHAQLLRSLGVSQLAVAVTKLDTCAFSQARYEEIRGLLQPFLRQCGYPETSVRWLPVSGPTGQNITERPSEAALASWWTGPTLLQVIDSFAPPGQQLTWPLRLPVSDVAGSRAGSAVLSGKLEAGSVQVGDKVTVVPGGQEGTVKAISVDGEKATRAGAGDAAEVTVQGLDASLLSPGAVLCAAGHPIPLASRFRTRVLLFDPPSPIIMGQPVTVHAHAAQGSGHVVALGPLLDPRSGNVVKDRQRALTKGQTAEIVVAVQRPLPLELYKDLRPLGRVALREKGRTLAVGIVTEIL